MALLNASDWNRKLFDGGWVEASSALDVMEPATEEVLTVVGEASADDVDVAVRRAQEVQPGWAARSYEERAEVMRRAAAVLDANHDELRTWITRETGKITPAAGFELHVARNELLEAAAILSSSYGKLLPSTDAGRLSMIRRVPYGVVGVISPWNYPLILSIRSVAPALALGNAVVLKPDPNSPITGGYLIARLLQEGGLPEGLLHVLPGGASPGSRLVEHPQIPVISFTGSTEVGQQIGEAAGKRLKRTILELGGNNAMIVLDDADVDAASSAGAWGSFVHQGQVCMTTGRHLVHERIADEYLEHLSSRAEKLPIGDPHREDVAIGPLINRQQFDRVKGIVDDSVSGGAEIVRGRDPSGLFFPPTVLTNVTTDMRAFREEIFGPVAPVMTFTDEDEALALANASDYGLSAAIHSRDVDRALRLADRMNAGMVHINETTVDDEAHVPFGGIGASGNGSRIGGEANWQEFTYSKWVTLKGQAAPYPF